VFICFRRENEMSDEHKIEQNKEKSTAFILIVVTIAALGGLLFGYDQGVSATRRHQRAV
jgi:hypothetical protein